MSASPTSFTDLIETYVQGKKAIRSVDTPTPDHLRASFALWASGWVANNWPLGTDNLQGTIDSSIQEYTDIWNGWFPPVPPPVVDNPLVYDFGDGSYMPSQASLVGKSINDSLVWQGVSYLLKNFPSGIMTYSPRWVKQ